MSNLEQNLIYFSTTDEVKQYVDNGIEEDLKFYSDDPEKLIKLLFGGGDAFWHILEPHGKFFVSDEAIAIYRDVYRTMISSIIAAMVEAETLDDPDLKERAKAYPKFHDVLVIARDAIKGLIEDSKDDPEDDNGDEPKPEEVNE